MNWQGHIEHEVLFSTAMELSDELSGMAGRLLHEGTHHVIHSDMADRCRSLSLYIDSAIMETVQNRYAPAFSILRSSLEHMLVDQLVFLGQRYVEVYTDVSDELWDEWQRSRDSGEAWQNVVSWSRIKRSGARVIRSGYQVETEEGEEFHPISVQYLLLKDFSPFLGPPREQEYFDDGLTDQSIREREADRHKQIYNTYLRWQSIKESLQANRFADELLIRQIDVHYRFLSAFVHPTTDMISLIYGRNQPNWPSYDHYSSELALLYCIVLSVLELQNFRKRTQLAPLVQIADWDRTQDRCRAAWDLTSYLWFPGQGPHSYDRFCEANRRGFREQLKSGSFTRIDPSSLPDSEVIYYSNPLERIVKLHQSVGEIMTGYQYFSPFHRADAVNRL